MVFMLLWFDNENDVNRLEDTCNNSNPLGKEGNEASWFWWTFKDLRLLGKDDSNEILLLGQTNCFKLEHPEKSIELNSLIVEPSKLKYNSVSRVLFLQINVFSLVYFVPEW